MPICQSLFAALAASLFLTLAPAQDLQSASAQIEPVRKHAEEFLVEGRRDEATELVLNAFPEATRTPIQALVLGNVLFIQDRANSYKLHKFAAEGLPDDRNAQYEWALEQHRAGEFAGALATYTTLADKGWKNAALFGLAAECALRTGDVAGACKWWAKSESTKSGSLEQFESLVCELHDTQDPFAERDALIKAVDNGDPAAAANLILLDLFWPYDWWNTHAHNKNLSADLVRIDKKFPAPKNAPADAKLKAARCAAALELEDASDSATVRRILLRDQFLLDPAKTIPANGRALAKMISAILDSDLMITESLRESLGDKLLAAAKTSTDPEFLNAVAHLYLETDKLAEIDRLGRDNTKDPRFTASLLLGKSKPELKWDDPDLQRALRDFPADANIAQIAFRAGMRAKQPKEQLLIAAIKAEFTKFSSGRTSIANIRPSAIPLRVYFQELCK